MTKVKFIKYGGMLGALITGAVMIVAGNVLEGVGVISASLSSAGVFSSGD